MSTCARPRPSARRRLPGLPLAEVRSARLDTWHAPDVFDASDDPALWQHEEQASLAAAMIAVALPPASLAPLTITLST